MLNDIARADFIAVDFHGLHLDAIEMQQN
jgi:hypothetical protein